MKIQLLSEVAEIIMGQAPTGDTYNVNGNGLPLIAGAGDFGLLYPIPKRFTTRPSKISRQNDIILCIRATIGDLNWSDKEYCLGRGVCAIRAKLNLIDYKYLWWLLNFNEKYLESLGRGATFKQISKIDIENLEIPLPPLDEQKRIAAILDQADELRRKRQHTITRLNQLSQAIFYDMFGDPVTNPKGLKNCGLMEALDFKTGKIDVNEAVPNGEYPFFTCAKDLYWIDKFSFDCEALLLAGNNATADYDVKYYNGKFNAYQRTYVIQIKNTNELTYTFVKMALENLLKQLKRFSKGSNTKYITLEILGRMQIAIPPVSFQIEFDRKMNLIWDSLRMCNEAVEKANALFASLQHKAFRGEL